MSIYAGTWRASGAGTADRSDGTRRSAQWKLEIPPQPKTLAVFIRASDNKLIVRQWGSQLSVANALTGSRRIAANNPEAINSSASEWNLGWIEADPAKPEIGGSRSIAAEALQADLMPPAGVAAVPQCSWQLARGSGAATAVAVSQASTAVTNPVGVTRLPATSTGCFAVAASLANLYAVLSADATRQYDSIIQSAGDANLATALSSQKGKMLAALATQQQQDSQAAANACGQGSASQTPAAGQVTSGFAAARASARQALTLPLTLAPASTSLDRPSVTVTFTGQNTHFAQGVTSADFHLPGVQPVLTVVSPTTATAQLTLPAGTPTGRYTVTLATGSEVAEASDGFMVTPRSDLFASICTVATSLGTLAPGQSQTATGVVELASAEDWFKVAFPSGASLNFTLRSATAGSGGSDFQLQLYSSCGVPIGAVTTGAGQKTAVAPDSGAHTVLVRVTANPWDLARPTYVLLIESR